MSENLKVLQVFIASPNDLVDERRAIKEVADELNAAFSKTIGLQIQLLGWEDRLPGYGRAQAQINEDVDKADLFVGFLWRRWGSDTGNSKYTSGFEEEFNRAVERRERSGSPEISIFFKEVNIKSTTDLDDQLKQVLEFREAVASKKLLFGNFTSIEEWKKKTWELLHGHLLKLLRSTMEVQSKEQPQSPQAPSPDESAKDATGQKRKSSTAAAKQQIVRLWGEALEAIAQGELSELSQCKTLNQLEVARLGLAAVAITNRDIEAEIPGVHLTNLLFKSRKQIELTQLEWFLLLKSNLLPSDGYHPCWYWIKKTTLNVKRALIYLACYDKHQAVRKAALDYAIGLNLPLNAKTGGTVSHLEVLSSHDEPLTRKAVLEYFSKVGSAKDLALVEKLRTDGDNDVRTQAEIARDSILLRENASYFFESSVLTSPWISKESIRAIQAHVTNIESDVLRKALAHPDVKVQLFAAKQLAARSLISLEEIQRLKDGEGACEASRVYFLNAIGAGQKFSPKEIRQALKPTGMQALYFHTPVDVDDVLSELFKLYTYEELLMVADSESDDAPIAYQVLAEKHFGTFGGRVRADLNSDFAVIRAKIQPKKRLDYLATLFEKQERDVSDFNVAALSGLAINGDSADHELVLPFLENKAERVRIAAIICLRRVGQPLDKEKMLQIADQGDTELAAEAAKTALVLAPSESGSASRLMKSAKPALVRLALLSILSCDANKVWPQIEDRLYDNDEEIRKLICAYAVRKFSTQRLVKLLDKYLSKERYFYNVVYFLDRAIYAKPPLRKLFINEIEETLG